MMHRRNTGVGGVWHGHCRADELDRVLRLLKARKLVTISQEKSSGAGRPTQMITRSDCEVSEVIATDYVALSNSKVKEWQLSDRNLSGNCEVITQTGSEGPLEASQDPVPPSGATASSPDNGDKIPADVSLREPGEEDPDEEEVIL